ncbi:DUF4435 domain-containing protein [Mesorhizobium sp.]|uniref:DUF4435 domain-containing protein n=1 Tax=Mesorhizobium sp. TaxID=1871066 RepID=UPI0012247BAE|nr:DUF4435 domain-containing protein [Mesorhizobium sp.]TIL48851.1 MAG: DUF4435 domain-containing protein [Mesorhizobium sp.]
MSFRRSDAGVSNYKHFLDVDLVAYVEGKTDVAYWETLFVRFRPDLKVRYEKKEGVDNLADIIDAVILGRISNVVVCRDADYVPLIAGWTTNNRILRTHGYSFENDFITPEAAATVARLIAPAQIDETFLQRAFRRYLAKLSKLGEWLLRLDVGFSATGEGLIVRTNPRDLMTGDDRRGYDFSENDARARLAGRGQQNAAAAIDFDQHGSIYPRYFCGHSMLFVLFNWCRVIVQRRAGRPQNASNGVIMHHLFSHYERLVATSTREFMARQLAAV